MRKKILGLDLGTTSIGWAVVNEDEDYTNSNIEDIGVRIIPLSIDEITDFEKGKPISTNASRTLARSARRNLQRYKLRRDHLKKVLLSNSIISDNTKLAEDGSFSTFQTLKERALAATEKISLDAFARVLFTINKKRGYKSSRKAKSTDEGHVIDGMSIAKRLYEEKITPGELAYQLLKEGKKVLPEFYRSDLLTEFEKVWAVQKSHHADILTEDFKKALNGKGQRQTATLFWTTYQFNTADIKGSRDEKKLKTYEWRAMAVHQKLEKEALATVITSINNDINQSSGYLGEISDRSKILFFNNITVGQYLYQQIKESPHTKLKGQVFYRQDYLDEFERIWETQAKFHEILTPELKSEIRDIIIFYQRSLKSQKGLLSFCEFEVKEKEIENNGKIVIQKIGPKVAPKSSPLFQEFKIWQILNHLELRNKITKEKSCLDQDTKVMVFEELNIKGGMTANQFLKFIGYKESEWEVNYKNLEGNRTNKVLYNAFLKILEEEGYSEDFTKGKNQDDIDVSSLSMSGVEIKKMIKEIFDILGINTEILEFNAELGDSHFDKQKSYQFWHLLYSIGDDIKKHAQEDLDLYGSSDTGLRKKICENFGFKPSHARILSEVVFEDDYGNLSSKAMRKIFPFVKDLPFDKACLEAKYNHSKSSLTKEENEQRELKEKLAILKKNELRNPVVEKILNQMVNVVNSLVDKYKNKYNQDAFHFDEIRIELSRELKKNAQERAELTANVNAAKIAHEKIVKILQSEFGVSNPSRNDIIRYKLYEELKNNGYKDLYTNRYISKEQLFSKEIDVDHIIPQMLLFDDSFSNKTLCFKSVNIEKGNKTANDYIKNKFGDSEYLEFKKRIEDLYQKGLKNPTEGISKAKFLKLQKEETEIGEGFIERDLREGQYIAKKAKELLHQITRRVVSTSGEITAKLRQDWDLMNVMQEINYPKYKMLGLVESFETKDKQIKERIKDWTKRDDHRHHAVDALVIAFTRPAYIQFLNHLNARKNEKDKYHATIKGIEINHTIQVLEGSSKKRKFKLPFENFRSEAKNHIESIIVSFKAKNKVVTKNRNIIKVKNDSIVKTELTPRGQLHKESVYGKYHFYNKKEEKIGAGFTIEKAQSVANPTYRKLLLDRLAKNDNDPKKAFTGKNSLSKNPIIINEKENLHLPEKVILVNLEEDYSIRKVVSPDNFKDEKSFEKILDQKVKEILIQRFHNYGGDAKKAFSDLEKNPIWFNKEAGIAIKSVKISGVKNAEPLHFKKDHFGNILKDAEGNPIPNSYVSTGNNHHVAIYEDEKGNLQEVMVSFFDAVRLANAGLPIVNKEYNQGLGWKFLFSMKQNEMFVFPNEKDGFDPRNLDLFDPKNKQLIAKNIYRVQKLASKYYVFRHQYETKIKDHSNLNGSIFLRIQTVNHLRGAFKIGIDHIGQFYKVNE